MFAMQLLFATVVVAAAVPIAVVILTVAVLAAVAFAVTGMLAMLPVLPAMLSEYGKILDPSCQCYQEACDATQPGPTCDATRLREILECKQGEFLKCKANCLPDR